MYWEDRLDLLQGFNALDFVEMSIRGAALYTRQYIQDSCEDTAFTRLQALSTVARVVWRQDINLATNMCARDPLINSHLTIVGQAVFLTNPIAFASLSDEARANDLSTRIAALSNSASQSESMLKTVRSF